MAKDYYSRAYACPYIKSTRMTSIRCEDGHIGFEDKGEAEAYVKHFCCDKWQECPTAKRLNEYYERKYRTS